MDDAVDVAIVGAGQCGLAVGYRLQKAGLRIALLDAGAEIGHAWRSRYDLLRLFTPTVIDRLPGMRFPPIEGSFPTKDEMADYLAAYARRFRLPVRLGARVVRVEAAPAGYRVAASTGMVIASQVVVATGAFQHPRVPDFAADLAPEVHQVHSSRYRNPDRLPREGEVLVVGAANSGAQIAMEVAASGRRTHLAAGGRPFYSSPKWLLESVSAWRLARIRSLYGRRRVPLPWPLGNTQFFFVGDFFAEVRRRNIALMPRVTGAAGDRVSFADGRTLKVGCVIWATGYRSDYSWIDPPLRLRDGAPVLVDQAQARPGLSFIGLWRQRSLSSALIAGVRPDSAHVARTVLREAGRRRGRRGGRDGLRLLLGEGP